MTSSSDRWRRADSAEAESVGAMIERHVCRAQRRSSSSHGLLRMGSPRSAVTW